MQAIHTSQGFVISFDSSDSLLDNPATYPSQGRWLTTESPAAHVWCYGEVLSYSHAAGTEDCLRHALGDWETGQLDCARLNGRFVLIFRQKAADEWTIVTDRVGAMHSYGVWRGNRLTAIGSDLLTLARTASSRTLDWEAVTSFFSCGFFLDDRTYFSDIKILHPRSIYRIDRSGVVQDHRYYWHWQHEVDPNRSYDQTVELYDALLRQAMRRATANTRVVLPISGGLDSRSLAAMLPLGTHVASYSYGYSADSIETSIAGRIAKSCGLPFQSQVILPYLFDRLPEIVMALHGCQDVTQARQMSANSWVQAHGDVVLTGLWGDVWCDQMGLADGLPDGVTVADHTLKKFQKRGRAWLLQNICTHQIRDNHIQETLAEKITVGLRAFKHIKDMDFQIKAYKTSRWAFRWSNASLRGFEVGAVPRIPYYDVDLIDFFCTVPTAFVRDRRLQIDHLKRFAPALARIHWQDADANLYLAKYGYWLGLPRRAIRKTERALKHIRPVQRNWEVQFLSPAGRMGLQEWLLRSDLALHNYVEPAAIASLLENFYAQPDAANGYTVSMLLTFAAWLEMVHS
ncbi:MAG: hypothetical protein IT324_22405 [Anaerolineae bacterium]|nr:hypothetical protein [Anaerolineae bacterium]